MTGYSNNHRMKRGYVEKGDSRFGTPISEIYGIKKVDVTEFGKDPFLRKRFPI
jgi:hypothetical protein